MPDDAGGRPFPDGEEPDSQNHGHGDAEDPFASVVLDEDFVRSAKIHEPSAVERMLAAAQSRRALSPPADEDAYDETYDEGRGGLRRRAAGARDLDPDDAYGPYGRYGGLRRPYRGHARWHRPVAWVLAVLMGIGVVALAFTAVYRGASSNSRQGPAAPPATSGVDSPAKEHSDPLPSVSADSEPPVASAAPRHP
ncbi:hypothetical protein AB0I22_18070 [Streptomyces sp. NPDC050610]|uniref:SCO2584 family spore wall biosynthesis protein n=1 Tax=Streptomyces sp. NPDC050610 TaxID=3157097 RepID=UPI00341E68C4